MDNNQSWNDFHFLNAAFSDVLAAMSSEWVEPSLVRFSYRGSKDKAINHTVEAIDGLFMEYAVPFPLTYIFGPRILQVHNSVFVFLLQIRRAKSVLERILARGSITRSTSLGSDLKALYAMRSKLSWFTKYAAIRFIQREY
jgi:gamma-tubulin complex component 5